VADKIQTTGDLSDAISDREAQIAHALAVAQKRCAEKGLRLTPVRRKVLELLLTEDRALGAYAILDVLREAKLGSKPPAVYRALEFLTNAGLVHKIEKKNAFVACDHPEHDHSPVFLICRVCDMVSETHVRLSGDYLDAAASESGFRIEHAVVEAEGICPDCVEAKGA